MYLIYVDECGYQVKWPDKKVMKEQPVYVVSAVAVADDSVEAIYRKIRKTIARLNISQIDAHALGRGHEIKSSQVDRGEGFWKEYPDHRNKVRKIYLDHSEVTYFVICINKYRHYGKYKEKAEDPANLGLKYLLERIQGFLKEYGEQGIIIIDANRRIEPRQRELLQKLLRKGSEGISRFLYGALYNWRLKMENIIEIHFSDSRDSLGLQIADFVARHTYSWWKSGKKKDSPGWSYIEPKLWKYPNHYGWGYKEFPEEDKV